MGLQFSRIWERMFGKKEMRILMVGLDAAGKVSFLLFLIINIFLVDVSNLWVSFFFDRLLFYTS